MSDKILVYIDQFKGALIAFTGFQLVAGRDHVFCPINFICYH